MARARRSAVKVSAPWATKCAAHARSRSAVSGSHTLTWPTSVVWCSWLRRASSVREQRDADAAAEVADHVEAAVALPICSRGMVASATVLSGTKMKPMPKPWTKRGHASAQ